MAAKPRRWDRISLSIDLVLALLVAGAAVGLYLDGEQFVAGMGIANAVWMVCFGVSLRARRRTERERDEKSVERALSMMAVAARTRAEDLRAAWRN